MSTRSPRQSGAARRTWPRAMRPLRRAGRCPLSLDASVASAVGVELRDPAGPRPRSSIATVIRGGSDDDDDKTVAGSDKVSGRDEIFVICSPEFLGRLACRAA